MKIEKDIVQSNKELSQLQEKIEERKKLKDYQGFDRVIHISEKEEEIKKQQKIRGDIFIAESGLAGLEALTGGGFREGQLIILSGSTKNGKTTVLRTLTTNFTKKGYKSLWFPYEESYEEMLARYSGKVDFYIPKVLDSGNIDWVEERILESKEKFGTQIVFLDDLDNLKDTSVLRQANMNLPAYIGGIIQKLKNIARDNRMIIFLTCHIKKNDWSSNKLPTSEDIRDSGSIPQKADTVMMILRKRDLKSPERLYLDGNILGVIENRYNGKTGKIDLTFENGIFKEQVMFGGEEKINVKELWK